MHYGDKYCQILNKIALSFRYGIALSFVIGQTLNSLPWKDFPSSSKENSRAEAMKRRRRCVLEEVGALIAQIACFVKGTSLNERFFSGRYQLFPNDPSV